MTKASEYDPSELAAALFEQAADAMFLFHRVSEQIIDVNPMAVEMTGAPRAELLGRSVHDLFHSNNAADAPLRDLEVSPTRIVFLRDFRAEGARLPVQRKVALLKGKTGPLALLMVRDVSEQRPAQRQLLAMDAELHRMLASVSECVWSAEIDLAGRWRLNYCSPVIDKICGTLPASFSAAPHRWRNLVHPDDRARIGQLAGRTLDVRDPMVEEYRIILPDGAIRWVRDSFQIRASKTGGLVIDGVLSDVTERKQAEEEVQASQRLLEESRHLFATFMNTIPIVGFIKDAGGRMVYVNQEFTKKFAAPVEALLGKLDGELFPADVARRLHDTDLKVMAGTQPVEVREFAPTPDGVLREWWVVKFPIRSAQGSVLLGGVALDLTERRHLEDSLRRSEERYRLLWQRNLAGVFRATLDGRILDCNDSFARIYGFSSREDMLNRSACELYFDPSVRAEFIDRVRELGQLTNYEIHQRRADGSPVWVLENVTLLMEDNQGVLEGTVIDISERKRIEEALRSSETNYRTLIHSLDQAIFLKDRELRYVTVNPVFCAAVGRSEQEMRGKTSGELFPAHLIKKSHALELQVLEQGRAVHIEDVLTIGGKRRQMRISRTPVKDEAGRVTGVLGIAWDITEQRAMDEQMRHVQKMNAIGQLAGGIAHDFNNLLTIMLGNLSFALKRDNDVPTILDLVRNAETAGLRAAALTQTVLGLSRHASLATGPVNLGDAIDEVIRLTRSTIPEAIELHKRVHDDLWLVEADAGQMNQVLTNLTLNARDAMPHGGKLTFQTSHFTPDPEYLASHVEARPGEFVRLRVEDTGTGIPPEIREHIFEPFFTTKEKGKGTGLGLAVAFSIVKQHKGWIVCDSEPGHGARFDIFLPRSTARPTEQPLSLAPPALPRQAIILLVDDEEMIRKLSTIILTRAGHRILTAENGEKALELVRAGAKIDLVILDSVMPRLSGRDTLRELVRLKPDIRVLFSSGFSTEAPSPAEYPQVRGFLPKPYRTEQLIQKVDEILKAAVHDPV